MSRRRSLVISAAIVLAAMFSTPISPASGAPKPGPVVVGTYTDVDVLGRTDAQVTGVNHSGVIVGNYGLHYDTHGFIKVGDAVTTIDVGAPEAPEAVGTLVRSINDAGTVVGSYFTWPSGELQPPDEHAFIRAADGTITTFDDPALVTTDVGSYGTVATGINSSGVVVGYSYVIGPDTFEVPNPDGDPSWEAVTHNRGFIRSSDGSFQTYDAPGAASSDGLHVGTRLMGINTAGTMVGTYTYVKGTRGGPMPMDAGFSVSGKKFTRIVDPSSDIPTNSCGWHEPNGINDAGVIVGNSGNACGGFREAWALSGGVFTYLSYTYPDPYPWVVDPDDPFPPVPLTIAAGVNNDGVISGTWGNGRMNGWSHGFTATFTTN